MIDRDFTEVDLRSMLEGAESFRPDILPARWIIGTQHFGNPWEVIVEPDQDTERLVVITAYSV